MQENIQESAFIRLMKKVWPFFHKVLNSIIYFFMSLIKGFFKNAMQMIKGS